MRVIDVQGNAPEKIADALSGSGLCRVRDFIPDLRVRDLHDEARALDAANCFTPAGVGSGGTLETSMRADRTLWLDAGACKHGGDFLDSLHVLSQALRDSLRMPIHGVEAHYAIYPPGGRYVRHRDQMHGDRARMISWVTYLNPEWAPEDGGMLRLYDAAGGFVEIAPEYGTSVCFLSEIEHEVMESRRTRLSIAGWMRRLD